MKWIKQLKEFDSKDKSYNKNTHEFTFDSLDAVKPNDFPGSVSLLSRNKSLFSSPNFIGKGVRPY